jgi:hypothetical protein
LFRNQIISLGLIGRPSLRWLEYVKGWGGKMKNREEWKLIIQEGKAHLEL